MKRNTYILSGLVIAALLGSIYLAAGMKNRAPMPLAETSLSSSADLRSKIPHSADPVFRDQAGRSSGQRAPEGREEVTPEESPAATDIIEMQSLDSEQLLRIIEEGGNEEIVHQAIEILRHILQSEMHDNRAAAYGILLRLKDMVKGEDMQSVFKEFASFADLGGNDVIVKSALLDAALTVQDQVRLLTYVDHQYPLQPQTVELLARTYENAPDDQLPPLIARTLAMAGEEAGVAWVMDKANSSSSFSEWQLMISSLAVSQSITAFDYLHKLLNDLAPDAPMYNEQMEIVRQAISSLDHLKK
jgi:hypothetical protein